MTRHLDLFRIIILANEIFPFYLSLLHDSLVLTASPVELETDDESDKTVYPVATEDFAPEDNENQEEKQGENAEQKSEAILNYMSKI